MVPRHFVQEVPLPQMSPNGLLLRVLYLSLDPYMRGRMDDAKSYAKSVGVGEVMTGESIYQVIASDRAGYVKGDIALAPTGWLTHAAWDGPALRKLDPASAPITTGLGVLGMPGFTAYAGLNLIGKPKAGETVVVAADSGPVGSLVGQSDGQHSKTFPRCWKRQTRRFRPHRYICEADCGWAAVDSKRHGNPRPVGRPQNPLRS
jgi:NADPH-dependent curcumin reductase CurA